MESFKEKVLYDYIKYKLWQEDLYKNGSISKNEMLNELELFFMAGNFQGYEEYISLLNTTASEQIKHASLLNERIKTLQENIIPVGLDYYVEGLYKELDDNETGSVYPEFYNNLDFKKSKTPINKKEKAINQITAYEVYGSAPSINTSDYINMLSENEDLLFMPDIDGEISFGGKHV